MNRRQFLVAPLVALPMLALAPPASATMILYPYWVTDPELRMWVISVNQGERVGMWTVYIKPDPTRVHPGTGAEIEWFTTPDELRWAREFYPEAFDPRFATGGYSGRNAE